MIHGNEKHVAVIIPLDDLRLLELIEDELGVLMADEAMAEIKRNGAIDWETLKAKPGCA